MLRTHFSLDMLADGVAVIKFVNVNQSVNVLEKEVLVELNDLVSEISNKPAIKGMIFYSGKSEHFIVGADIKDIEALANDPDNARQKVKEGCVHMQSILQKISELPFETVCAIHGGCLGGGFELALAFNYRILTDDLSTKLSFPEVKLGLLPGAGGTQRLSRLIGLLPAIDIVTSTRSISAKKAFKLGICDALVSKNRLLEIASGYAKGMKQYKSNKRISFFKKIKKKSQFFLIDKNPLARKLIFKLALKKIEKASKGFYPAPVLALKAVMEGYALPLNLGLKREARYFSKLAISDQSKSLIHLYHATNHIKKSPFSKAKDDRSDSKFKSTGSDKNPSNNKNHDSFDISHLTVIGSGFMGAGIATLSAYNGIKSRLVDPSVDALKLAMAHSAKFFNSKVKRRRLKTFEANQARIAITPSLKPINLHSTDLVIEAVYENLALKKKILSDFEKNTSEDHVFASNTSAIPIKDIAKDAQYPQRVVGAHFFSPVEKMPLLEIVKTDKSSHKALNTVFTLGQKLKKQVIVVHDGPGFYTTRALAFFLAEAISILQQGVSILDLDRAMTKFGFPVGPLTLLDEVGIDVGVHVLDTMVKAFPGRISKSAVVDKLIDKKILGKKNHKGLYLYKKSKTSKNSEKKPNLEVEKMFHSVKSDQKLKVPDTKEIQTRLSLVFVNESVRCLDDKILDHPYDGDVGAVFGLGFPPFLGGPFFYADKLGAEHIINWLSKFQEIYGDRFAPANTLIEMAKDSSYKFFD